MGLYSEYSNQKLFTNTALQNRLNGVQGHTMLGVFLAGNATNIASGIGDLLNGSNNKSSGDLTGPATTQEETENLNEQTSNMARFRKALDAFAQKPSKKGADELKNMYEENKDNPKFRPHITRYEMMKTKIDEWAKKSQQA